MSHQLHSNEMRGLRARRSCGKLLRALKSSPPRRHVHSKGYDDDILDFMFEKLDVDNSGEIDM